ncbi:MAG: hypothetical protein HY695_24020 [Deltaproteobacteria bacterium]|nr:hypothetical protein [Deltaproteobacteria bacterium]
MGLFDSIYAALACPVCRSVKEREIQTKKGPCLMLRLEVGDTIEPFFYGDYWIEEEWDCDDCRKKMPEESQWHKAFIHCINGLIVEVTPEKPPPSDRTWETAMKRSKNPPLWLRRLDAVKAEMKTVRFPRTAQEGFRQCADLSETALGWFRQSVRDGHPRASAEELEKERCLLVARFSAAEARRIVKWKKERGRYFRG